MLMDLMYFIYIYIYIYIYVNKNISHCVFVTWLTEFTNLLCTFRVSQTVQQPFNGKFV